MVVTEEGRRELLQSYFAAFLTRKGDKMVKRQAKLLTEDMLFKEYWIFPLSLKFLAQRH